MSMVLLALGREPLGGFIEMGLTVMGSEISNKYELSIELYLSDFYNVYLISTEQVWRIVIAFSRFVHPYTYKTNTLGAIRFY